MTPAAIPNSWAASCELKTRGPILLEAMIGMPSVVNAIQTLLMKKTISHGVLGGSAGCLF
jgi:gamma-glutamyl phosphate reductase|tara:strand:- start:30 stop:209 length:180 start_codon:yes stop_codon:yes gene_type:complete